MYECEFHKSSRYLKYYQSYNTKCRKKQTKNKTTKAFVRHELVYKQLFLSLNKFKLKVLGTLILKQLVRTQTSCFLLL